MGLQSDIGEIERNLTPLEKQTISATPRSQDQQELYQTFMTQRPDIDIIHYEN